jgi:Tfp pilus assembly protein PilF
MCGSIKCWRFPAVASEPDAQVTILDAAEARFAHGRTMALLDRWPEAVEAFDAAIDARPEFAEAWNQRGAALQEMGEAADALDSFGHALRLRPDFAAAHNNRGITLRWLNRAEESIEAADMALRCDPSDTRAYTTRGHALRALGRVNEALENYDRAVAAFPSNGVLHFNRAACLLLLGDFERGLTEYEWRWQRPQAKQHERILRLPLWLGDASIAGKTILLHAEQGIGDTIQFCRYASLVAELGAKVLIGVPPPLRDLMATIRGVAGIVSQVDVIPGFDLQCPLLSLPLAFRTRLDTIPAEVPYLFAPQAWRDKWRARLGSRRHFRVGIAWAGNPAHRNDHNRSLTLEQIVGLVPPNVEFYCLQRDMRPRDIPALAMYPHVRYLGADLADFSDTAAVIAEMDLVISVDTSVLHLAGAMGAPAWGLLPSVCDWRWLLDRPDSPWYPSIRLFRQDTHGDWSSVLALVGQELERTIQASPFRDPP